MDTKKWYLSKGVDGSLAAVLTTVILLALRVFGINAESEQASISELVVIFIALAGGIIALIGRLKATTKVTM